MDTGCLNSNWIVWGRVSGLGLPCHLWSTTQKAQGEEPSECTERAVTREWPFVDWEQACIVELAFWSPEEPQSNRMSKNNQSQKPTAPHLSFPHPTAGFSKILLAPASERPS